MQVASFSSEVSFRQVQINERESKSARSFGHARSISASGFGPEGPILGGSNQLWHRGGLIFFLRPLQDGGHLRFSLSWTTYYVFRFIKWQLSTLLLFGLTNRSEFMLTLYTLSPDENEISLYRITTCLNIKVTRIKEVITEDRMSWYLDKFSLLVP